MFGCGGSQPPLPLCCALLSCPSSLVDALQQAGRGRQSLLGLATNSYKQSNTAQIHPMPTHAATYPQQHAVVAKHKAQASRGEDKLVEVGGQRVGGTLTLPALPTILCVCDQSRAQGWVFQQCLFQC